MAKAETSNHGLIFWMSCGRLPSPTRLAWCWWSADRGRQSSRKMAMAIAISRFQARGERLVDIPDLGHVAVPVAKVGDRDHHVARQLAMQVGEPLHGVLRGNKARRGIDEDIFLHGG